MPVTLKAGRTAHLARFTTPRLPATRAAPAVKPCTVANAELKFEVTAAGDWVPAIASGLFIAAKQGVFTFSSDELRMVLAVSALALPVVNTLVRQERFDWVSSSLAPAALGAETLKLLSAVPAAVVAFGSSLCNDLAKFINFQGAFYGLLATLAVAVYYSKAVVWFTVAFALLTGTQFVSAAQDSKVLVIPGIFTGCLLYAIFDFVQSKSMGLMTEITLCIVAAKVAWSVFQTGRRLANEASEASSE